MLSSEQPDRHNEPDLQEPACHVTSMLMAFDVECEITKVRFENYDPVLGNQVTCCNPAKR